MDETPFPPRCAARFQPVRPLAQGGFAAVWVARQQELDRLVAVKLLHEHLIQQPDEVDRFRDEARITAHFRSPHIVTVLDYDVEDGVPWIAYELLPGRTLFEHMSGVALAPEEAVLVAMQVTRALEEAHGLGIIHRDLQPANLIDDGDGNWKLTDFGIAKWALASKAHTRTGCVPGTLAYLAPELIEGELPSPRSDLYALGVMLFQMLTGVLPFQGKPVEVCRAHLEKPVTVPSTRASGVPPELDHLVLALMAKRPGNRPASARAAREALHNALGALRAGPVERPTGQSNRTLRLVTDHMRGAGARGSRLRYAAAFTLTLCTLAAARPAQPPPAAAAPCAFQPMPAASAAPDRALESARSGVAEVRTALETERLRLLEVFNNGTGGPDVLQQAAAAVARAEALRRDAGRLREVLEARVAAAGGVSRSKSEALVLRAQARACVFAAWTIERRVTWWQEFGEFSFTRVVEGPRDLGPAGVPLISAYIVSLIEGLNETLARGEKDRTVELLEDLAWVAANMGAQRWDESAREPLEEQVNAFRSALSALPTAAAPAVRRAVWYMWLSAHAEPRKGSRRFYRDIAIAGLLELDGGERAQRLADRLRAYIPEKVRT